MFTLLGLLFLGDFVAPSPPPRAEYDIGLKIDPDKNAIIGTQTVRMKNSARGALRQVAVSWSSTLGRRLTCEFEGRNLDAIGGNPTMRHDQYGMVIDRKWVEERLEIPFRR